MIQGTVSRVKARFLGLSRLKQNCLMTAITLAVLFMQNIIPGFAYYFGLVFWGAYILFWIGVMLYLIGGLIVAALTTRL